MIIVKLFRTGSNKFDRTLVIILTVLVSIAAVAAMDICSATATAEGERTLTDVADAGGGYRFMELLIADGEIVSADEESGPGGFQLWMVVLLSILLAGILFTAYFYGRRHHDVIIQERSAIVGHDKARRNREYRFSVRGEFSGAASYRVGAEGQWKLILPDEDGTYVIPRGEVVDDIYLGISHRNKI
ncbi:MAG: hypothetical protein FWG60_02390 [Methanomassiliicoccaceae archaeon]|nr:hypothetical protein [Methanomassiliicoccaceae archaeon]